MKPPVILIANPVAKRASQQKIQKAVELLRAAGHDVVVRLTGKRGDAEEFARSASQGELSFVLAAGGDGTFNEVMNGIANTGSKMAILPMGTTNVLAKELDVPENVEGAVRVALNGKEHAISLGSITFTSHSSTAQPQAGSRSSARITRYFCLMAGIGFDGAAVYGINAAVKKYWGEGAYILSGLKTLAGYSPKELTFVVNGQVVTGYSAIVGNASKYGGNFRITPDAKLLSPDLYVYIMHGNRPSDIVRYVYGILAGSHLRLKDTTYLRADTVSVEGSAHIQIDGDYLGTTPATITVVPHAVRLLY